MHDTLSLSAGSWIGSSKWRDTCPSLCLVGGWIGALDRTYSWLDIRPPLRVVACWPSLSLLLHTITPHFFCPTSTGTLDKACSVRGSSQTKKWQNFEGEGIVNTSICQRISLCICCHIKCIAEYYIRQPSNIIQTIFLSIWYAVDGRTLLEKSAIVSQSV